MAAGSLPPPTGRPGDAAVGLNVGQHVVAPYTQGSAGTDYEDRISRE
jgi:hypothetical protein